MAMVGRETESAEVATALTSAREGHGTLVLVGGSAGIGKSVLADTAVQTARGLSMAVARGYAVDDPGAPPLWPWLRLMRDWPEAAQLLSVRAGEVDAAARFEFFVALTDVLRTRSGPDGLLVVLEDLHWADRTSVLLLRHVVTELADLRVAVVATHRDTVQGPLADLLPEVLRGARARAVTLTGLSVAEVGAWLPALVGHRDGALAAELQARTGGNPLLIKLVAEQMPRNPCAPDIDAALARRPQLRRLVVAKVAVLGTGSRAVVDAAAVLGERMSMEVLAAMTDRSLDEIVADVAEAVAAGVLRETGDGPAFEHALVRDAVYGELSGLRRTALHRRAAQALAAASAIAGPIAMHWRRSGDPDALPLCQLWAERADDQARLAFAHDDASRFAQLVVDCARERGADPVELARVLIRRAEADVLTNHAGSSAEVCAEAAELAAGAGRGDLVAQAGLVLHGVGSSAVLATVRRICARALAMADPDDHVTRARLLAQLAVCRTEIDGGSAGVELAADALAEAELCGDPVATLEAIAARHLAISVPDTVAERLVLGRRAIELSSSARQPIAALWGHLWRMDAALQLGNISELKRELAEIDTIATQRGSTLARWHHLRFTATRMAMTGDFAAGRRANDDAMELGRRVGDMSLMGMSYAFSGELSVVRGDPAEMPEGWDRNLEQAPPIPLVRILRPLQHALRGDLDRARAEFEEFRDLPATFPYGVRWAATLLHVGTTAILLDDAPVARAVLQALRGTAHHYSGDGSGGVFNHGSNSRLLGELAVAAGRSDEALPLFRDAVAMNVRVGARPYTALARLGWAGALCTLGQARDPAGGEHAEELLTQAEAEFARLDMPGPLARATSLAERIGPARRPESSLTTREAEVARLVADALSNKEIARRLFLSERTVETHVRSILAKLGFVTRTEIATWVVRTGP